MDPREVARIEIVLLDTGAMSVSGNIGDVKLALGMIDGARAAIAAKVGRPTILEPHGAGLVVPEVDARVAPNEAVYPLVAVGDRR